MEMELGVTEFRYTFFQDCHGVNEGSGWVQHQLKALWREDKLHAGGEEALALLFLSTRLYLVISFV